MAFLWSFAKKLDWILIIASVLLVSFGILAIYSSSLGKKDFLNFKKQIFFLTLGMILMFVLSFFDWRLLHQDHYLILILYFICLLLLMGLFFFAPVIRGVKSWYKIGSLSVDPVEFTKIVLLILLAKYFSMRHVEMYSPNHIIISGIYVLIPCLLIFFQPDFGPVLVLLSMWLAILVVSGIKLRHFLILFLCGILVLILAWSTVLKEYQKERIISFILPQISDPLNAGWSQQQSRIAVGSGGLLGQGIGRGSQTQYGFLPEPQTDFIFSVIAEETGLVGSGMLLFLFLILIWRILKIALKSKSNFSRLFAVGFSALLVSQIFIHVGMNTGLLPIIGLPLPLVSYGGSGLIAVFCALGILQSINRTA